MDHERRFVLNTSKAPANEALCEKEEGLAELRSRLEIAKDLT